MLDSKTINNQNLSPENLHIVRYEGVIVNAIYSQGFLFGESDIMKFKRRDKRQLCECGCGDYAEFGNRFIFGHQRRTEKFFIIKPSNMDAPYCKCNCKRKVTWNKDKHNWNEYIVGHNAKEQMKGNQHSKGHKHSEEFKAHMKQIMSGKDGINYGRRHAEETKELMSKIRKGKESPRKGCKLSEETKEKISLAHKGKKLSEEHKNKIRISLFKTLEAYPGIRDKLRTFKGKKHTKESKLKIQSFMINAWATPKFRNNLTGDKAAGWKGGISCEPYCDIWLDKDYKQSILERDNNKCQNPDCWNTVKSLALHHINYIKKDCDPWNLITLCTSCNSRANKNRKKHILFYQNIMKEKYGYKYA